MSKPALARFAQKHGFRVPATVAVRSREDIEASISTLRFPCVMKPATKDTRWLSHSPRKAFKVVTPTELVDTFETYSPWSDEFIVQEWVEGSESDLYSCNGYFDTTGDPTVTFVARKVRQWPPETGTSALGVECRHDLVRDETVRLFQTVGYRGLGYVEMKVDHRTDEVFLIEPNVGRPTGRSAIAEAGGVELLYSMYCDLTGSPRPSHQRQRYTAAKWIYLIEPNVGRPTGRSAIAEAGGVELLYSMYCDLTGSPRPSHQRQRYTAAKWIYLRHDVQAAFYRWRRGELSAREWWVSIRGPKAYAVLSATDPLPFLLDCRKALAAACRALHTTARKRRDAVPKPSLAQNRPRLGARRSATQPGALKRSRRMTSCLLSLGLCVAVVSSYESRGLLAPQKAPRLHGAVGGRPQRLEAPDAPSLVPRPRPSAQSRTYIWLSPAEIRALPIAGEPDCDSRCGAAWTQLRQAARRAPDRPDLRDQNEDTGNVTLAKALVAVRLSDGVLTRELTDDVVTQLRRVVGTEVGARALSVGRKLAGYVIAADIIDLPEVAPLFDDSVFRPWLRSFRKTVLRGRTLRSCHEDRPNNWGTHCGASRVAVAAYLHDRQEIEGAAEVFRGWLGERRSYAGFKFRPEASGWMGDPTCPPSRGHCRPRAINPRGATRDGHNVDGVLVDDQRRTGPFRWPPTYTAYSYGGLEGAVLQAGILHRLGFTPWQWGDEALRRAVAWMFDDRDGKEKWDSCRNTGYIRVCQLMKSANKAVPGRFRRLS